MDPDRIPKIGVPDHFFQNFHSGTSQTAIEACNCPFDFIFDFSASLEAKCIGGPIGGPGVGVNFGVCLKRLKNGGFHAFPASSWVVSN